MSAKRPLSALVLVCALWASPASAEPPVYHSVDEVPAEVRAQHGDEVLSGWIDAYWTNRFIEGYWRRIVAMSEAHDRAQAERAARPSVWDRLAQCESGGNWSINTGNGFYGGLQFSLRSWRGVGGTGYPHQHSREHQIEMGERLRANGGWRHWPACSRKLGLR